jgi:hypothetical protein
VLGKSQAAFGVFCQGLRRRDDVAGPQNHQVFRNIPNMLHEVRDTAPSLQLGPTPTRYAAASLLTALRLVLRPRTSKETSFLLVEFLVGQNSAVAEVSEFA